MASFSMDDFVGNGVLKELLPKLLEEGWDDVPTLKIMNLEDMDAIKMTQQQKDALEIRTYLHNRALMQYADKLESSKQTLTQLQALTIADMASRFGMKRGHFARFTNRHHFSSQDPFSSFPLPPRNKTPIPSRKDSTLKNDSFSPNHTVKIPTPNNSTLKNDTPSPNHTVKTPITHNVATKNEPLTPYNSEKTPSRRSMVLNSPKHYPNLPSIKRRSFINPEYSIEQSIADLTVKEGHVFKGVVAYSPAEPRACGCISPPLVVENIASYSTIENVSVHKITPEYKIGMERLVKSKTPAMKASELWRDKPAVFLCMRRPGCIMCRAEAHKLYAQKPIFDALGVQLFVVLHEYIESEVKDFWPRYWGGGVLYDKSMDFFKALGGGKLLKDKFLSGFLFNPRAIANYKRAKQMGVEQTFRGEGEIKGGLFIIGKGKSGIAYQFIERNFGDWAPLAEVVDVCTRMQNEQPNSDSSFKVTQEYE